MQPMTIMYEAVRATKTMEMRMLKAIVEPIMMRSNTAVVKSVKMTALRGMSQPGVTWENMVSREQCV